MCFDHPSDQFLQDIQTASMCCIEWSALPLIHDEAVTWLHHLRLGKVAPPPSHCIGVGGCGCVWRVEKRGIPFAVKVFDATVFEPTALRRVLGHPNVVYVVGYCREPAGVVTELVTLDGEPCSLRQWLSSPAGRRCDLDARLDLLRQLCDGMAFVHSRDLVHSDLKPSNVLMCRYSDGSLCTKIGDFGLAIDVLGGPTMRVGHTPAYACPCDEISRTDKHFDVWSFGLVMAEVILGTRLRFNGAVLSQWRSDASVQRRLSSDVMCVAEHCGVDCAEVWALVERCLRCDSSERPTFVELLRAIDDVQGSRVAPHGGSSCGRSVGHIGWDPGRRVLWVPDEPQPSTSAPRGDNNVELTRPCCAGGTIAVQDAIHDARPSLRRPGPVPSSGVDEPVQPRAALVINSDGVDLRMGTSGHACAQGRRSERLTLSGGDGCATGVDVALW